MSSLLMLMSLLSASRTGIWPQKVVGAPGVAFSVAMARSPGSFDRQMSKTIPSRPSRLRWTGGWSSGDLANEI